MTGDLLPIDNPFRKPTLVPLFSAGCDHVGWLQPDRFVFDDEARYVAFLSGGHAWSAVSAAWLGPAVGNHLFDTDLLPVAWSPGLPPARMSPALHPGTVLKPVTPVNPVRPVRPLRPLGAPGVAGGWSPLAFREWLTRFDPAPVSPAAEDGNGAAPTPDAAQPQMR